MRSTILFHGATFEFVAGEMGFVYGYFYAPNPFVEWEYSGYP
jgi:hypothetical protein